jgi:hypothetical protein
MFCCWHIMDRMWGTSFVGMLGDTCCRCQVKKVFNRGLWGHCDFKLSLCSVLTVSTFGCFPNVWFILGDVSDPSVKSTFKPLKMDLTEGSETSANINQTLVKHPKVDTVNTEHSESLKSRNILLPKYLPPHPLLTIRSFVQWNFGSRTPLFTNTSVHKQIFRAKKVSDDERCLGLRTRKLATEAS